MSAETLSDSGDQVQSKDREIQQRYISRRNFLKWTAGVVYVGGANAAGASIADSFIYDPKKKFVEAAHSISPRPLEEDREWANAKIDRITSDVKVLANSQRAREIPSYLDGVRPETEKASSILAKEGNYQTTLDKLSDGAGDTHRFISSTVGLLGIPAMAGGAFVGFFRENPNILQRFLLRVDAKLRRPE